MNLRDLHTRVAQLRSRVTIKRLQDAVIAFVPYFYATMHSAAVIAVALYGKPQIDEPLWRAYGRTMGELYRLFGTKTEQWIEEGTLSRDDFRALAICPEILTMTLEKYLRKGPKFTAALVSAPVWLLKFADVERDARILEFKLPDLSRAPKLGREARKDRNRWPLLPEGTIDAGAPCDEPNPCVTTEELLTRNTRLKIPSRIQVSPNSGIRFPTLVFKAH
jgi:hypothetical protein